MPHSTNSSRSATWSATLLRRDLSARAQHLARTQNLLHDTHPGIRSHRHLRPRRARPPRQLPPRLRRRICANPDWLRRLTKLHTASRRSRARKDWQWMELDSCNSSDALLMNIFCHPGVFNGHTLAPAVANLLNVDPTAQPIFGITPGVPLKHPRKGRSKLPSRTNRPHRDRPPTRHPLRRSQAHRIQLPIRRPAPHRTLPRPRSRLRHHPPPTQTPLRTPIPSTRRRLLPTRTKTNRSPTAPIAPETIRTSNQRLPTHPQRPRRLLRRRILLRPLRRTPPRPHRNLVLHPLRRPLPHLRHAPETPHLAGTLHHPPHRPPTIPRSKIRNPPRLTLDPSAFGAEHHWFCTTLEQPAIE